MNNIDEMPSKCQNCPYWELAKEPYCCDECGSVYDYQRASDMRDYCEHFESTYNPEDGSM